MTIKGYEGYEIFEDGTIITYKRGKRKILKQSLSYDGYAEISLFKNGKSKKMKVHRLVIEHFGNGKEKETVNHIDGNKLNNHIDNLEWATRSENMRHAYANKLKVAIRGTEHVNSLLSEKEVVYIRRIYKPKSKRFGLTALAKRFNVSKSTINRIVNGESYKNVRLANEKR